MNDPYFSDQEPFPAWQGTSGSHVADSELNGTTQSRNIPWNLDEICNYRESHAFYRPPNPLFSEISPVANRHASIPLPIRRVFNNRPQLQVPTRRAHRSSFPAVSSPAMGPTSYPYWVPAQRNSENGIGLPFDDYDSWWLDPAGALEESPATPSPVGTPTLAPLRAESVGRTSNIPRTGGRKRSSAPRQLQCTIDDDLGNRCAMLLAWDDTFRRHEQRHYPSEVWPCRECKNKEFRSSAELRRHYNDTLLHRGKENPEPVSVEKEKFPERLLYCPLHTCPRRRFRNLAERQNHIFNRHPEYVFRPVRSPRGQFAEPNLAVANASTYEGFDSSPSTDYGTSPFSERTREPHRRRDRADSATSSTSSATIYSTGECSPCDSPVANFWPQTYTANDFQPFYGRSNYGAWPSMSDAYGPVGYGTSQPDAYDFSGFGPSCNLRSYDANITPSAHPLPALLSSMHSGSTNSEADPLALDPRRISSESTRATVDTAMAELAEVFEDASLGWAAGPRTVSPDTDDDGARSLQPRRSRAVRQLRRIYGSDAAEQRPSRQTFLHRVLPGLGPADSRPADALSGVSRPSDRERGDLWTMVSHRNGDGPWDTLRRR